MRRSLAIVLVLMVLIAGAGCARTSDGPSFRIQVTGTKGVKFSGSCTYTVYGGYGDQKTRDLSGTVPKDFVINGTIHDCMLSNGGDSGWLRMTIVDKSGAVLGTTGSGDLYGVISLGVP